VPSCNGGALLSISYGWFNIQWGASEKVFHKETKENSSDLWKQAGTERLSFFSRGKKIYLAQQKHVVPRLCGMIASVASTNHLKKRLGPMNGFVCSVL
jgi:hypothetical protein